MTVAIHTRFIPASDKKQARVKAFANRGRADGKDVIFSVIISYDWSGAEHLRAAETLRDKYWPGEPLTFCGLAADGRGDVYTLSQGRATL